MAGYEKLAKLAADRYGGDGEKTTTSVNASSMAR